MGITTDAAENAEDAEEQRHRHPSRELRWLNHLGNDPPSKSSAFSASSASSAAIPSSYLGFATSRWAWGRWLENNRSLGSNDKIDSMHKTGTMTV